MMYHLPRFVTGRRKLTGKKGPKLERLNAMRYTDYEAPVCASAASPPSAEEEYMFEDNWAGSADVSEARSFRIEGAEGEVARICRSIGLSGPDDFDISTDDWEVMKGRACWELGPSMRMCGTLNLDGLRESEDQPLARDLVDRIGECVRISEEEAELNEIQEEGVGDCSVVSGPGRGIRGARPPVLSAPRGMTFSMMDGTREAWDMQMSIVPDASGNFSLTSHSRFISSIGGCGEESKNVSERDQVDIAGHGRIDTQYDSSIFSTSNDGDDVSPSNRFKPTIRGWMWMKGELLGRGSYGSVYEGISDKGFFFAIKEVSLVDEGRQAQQSVSQLEQEISLLRQFEHENIVQYYGTDKDDTNLYIFLEYVSRGSLLSLYRTYKLRDSQVSVYTRQILHGLKYLHDRNVIHRDIKCANILVDTSGSVKLADFGLAKATKKNDVKSCRGTPYWMAPEVANGKKQGYGLAADIWSLGCTVLEMLTQQIPYSHLEWMPAVYCIGKGMLPEIPAYLSEDSRDFILQCLKVNPSTRPTATQLLDHPFVKRSIKTPIGYPSPFHNRLL